MGVKIREKVTGSGVFWVFINHQGRRSSKQVGGEKAALKVKEIIEARLKLGQSFLPEEKLAPSVPTLQDYYRRFQDTYMETALRQSTRDSYESSFRVHILPELGGLRLDELSRERVEELIASLVKKGLAKDSVRLILAALGVMLAQAKEHKIVQENPGTRLGKFYKQARKVHEDIQPLTREEVPLFLQTARQLYPEHYPLSCAPSTAACAQES